MSCLFPQGIGNEIFLGYLIKTPKKYNEYIKSNPIRSVINFNAAYRVNWSRFL